MEEQQRLHLVEVIARYGDAVLAASFPSLEAQVGSMPCKNRKPTLCSCKQQLGQAVAAHPQDAAPATSGEPKKVRVRIDFPPFGKSDNENLMRWISHVSLAAKAMHLDDEGAEAKAVTSLLSRPAEWAHGQLSLNSNCFPDLDTFFAALKAFLAPPDSDFRNRTLFHKSVQGKLSIRDYANRLRYIYTLMIDRDSLNEATRVSVFMNGLVE
ncbi:hypothetical protein AeMF1_016618, partial [Aphanomyces euteiches]